MKKIALIITALFCFACKDDYSSRPENQSIVRAPLSRGNKRILFIGNSHTEFFVSLPEIFHDLCQANNKKIQIGTLIGMGKSLDQIYTTQNKRLNTIFSKKDNDGNYYDYVVIQEKTDLAVDDLKSYKKNVKLFVDDIHKNSPGTVVLLYELMTPVEYGEEEAFPEIYLQNKTNALEVCNEISNAKLLKIGTAIKDAYDGHYNYRAYEDNVDLLRDGYNTLYMANDAGFMSSVLLYETIFKAVPLIPKQLPLCLGTGDYSIMQMQDVSQTVSDKEALMKIAFDNK